MNCELVKKRVKKAKKYLDWNKPKQAIAELRPLFNNKQSCPWVAYHLMGVALTQNGNYEASLKFLQKALEQGSPAPETPHMLSVSYLQLGRFQEAENFARQAVSKNEQFLQGWLNLGSIYRGQAKLEQALECYKKANQLDPKNAGVAYRIGEIYRDQGDLEQAMQLFDITLKLDSEHKRAILEKAEIAKKKGNYEEAKACLDEAKEKHGRQTPLLVTEAELYKSRGDYDQAIALYEELLEKKPNNGIIRVNYALCLQELSRFEESEKNYRRAIKDMPGNQGAISNYLMGLHYNPKNDREYIFEEHVRMAQDFMPEKKPRRPVSEASKDKKLRVGFVSGGFRQHPVGWMIAGALEQLPADKFETYCYTTNNKFDFVTRRIHQSIDEWRSIVGYEPDVVTELLKDDELDILVDLSGHAADNCLEVMAAEPAPVIVKWVGGLFNTTGLPAFDFLISDWYETPKGEEKFYTEKLVRLPDDYISYTPPAYAPDVAPLPAESNEYITFGCFNNPTKVNDKVLRRWAEVMSQVPESRLFLKSKQYDTHSVREHITGVLSDEGISADRVLFKGHTPHDKHLEAYNKVDIALDPWPYSGGLTTCEALYMGVPVITLPGPTFAGRHSMTHLENAGLSHWVTKDWQQYREKTVGLATDRSKLKEWRQSLRKKLIKSPVCDGKRFGAHLAAAFRQMWNQWVEGQQEGVEQWQQHIEVEAFSDEEVEGGTDGPSQTPLIDVNTDSSNRSLVAGNGQGTSDALNMPGEDQKANSETSETDTPQAQVSTGDNSEEYNIKIKDDVTVCTPADVSKLTPFVLLEQEQWLDPEVEFLREFVQPGMNIIDGGASYGGYALPLAKKVGSSGTVHAFEPLSMIREYLEKSKGVNGFDQLKIYDRALGDEINERTLDITENPEFTVTSDTGDETAAVTTLDAWWSFGGEPPIDVIKLDLNGMEKQALQGATSLLKQERPVALISVGNDGQQFSALRTQLREMNYCLCEYIPGAKLLVEHEENLGIDPYMMNVVAIHRDCKKEFINTGWLYDANVAGKYPQAGKWEETIGTFSWANQQLDDWRERAASSQHDEYLQALDILCAASQVSTDLKSDPTSRSRKGAMMLHAAQELIEVFNKGNGHIPAALSYARVMIDLGKYGQAVEMLKGVMETVNAGKITEAQLPFLPPLAEQEKTEVHTNFSSWLTVRIVEAWIAMKDVSVFVSNEQEQQLLKALEGNPEATDWMERRLGLLKLKEKEQLTEDQKKRFKKSMPHNAKQLLPEFINVNRTAGVHV